MMRRLSLGLLALVACGGETSTQEPDVQDVAVRDWGPIRQRWPLSSEVRAVAAHEGDVFVGGEGFLGVVRQDTIEMLGATDVEALIPVAGLGVLVLDDEGGLHLWDDGLAPSPIGAALGGPAHALTLRRDEVWIASQERVFRWVDGALDHLELSARRLQGHTGGEGVVADGAWVTPTEGGFAVEELPGEAWLAAADDRLLVLDAGAVFERRDAGWVRLSLEGVRGGVVSASGRAYLIGDQGVLRLEGTDALRVDDPGAPLMAAGDALWWVVDGHLHRAGEAALTWDLVDPAQGGEVTYQEDIAPFSAANCERCHAPLRTARDLTTRESWVDNIEAAIAQLDQGLMPIDGVALEGGDVSLLRRWRDGGLLP